MKIANVSTAELFICTVCGSLEFEKSKDKCKCIYCNTVINNK